jgi:hypothetical protein
MKLTSAAIAATLLCLLPLVIAPARADDLKIEPGQWQITSRTVMNGAAAPPTVRPRCITPEQAGDLTKTFGPAVGTINSTCTPAEFETTGKKLSWRLECRGQMDMAVVGEFSFDSPMRYTATVASKAWMAGSLMSDVSTDVEAERIGECQP